MAEREGHRVIHAAGAVIWRRATAGLEVALVHRPRYDDWSHPKGKRQRGEHVLATAIREVREETGFGVVLGRPLSASVYEVAGGTKHVSFWVARVEESADLVPNSEVDQVEWLTVAAARERLTYERDIALLDELIARPVQTVPTIVLRHAEAGRKRTSGGDDLALEDLARPLDARGVAEAEALTTMLASYGRCQVMSSEAERCLATVRPYAQAVGAQVRAEPAFTIVPGAISPPEVLAAAGRDALRTQNGRGGVGLAGVNLARELATSGVPTLICAHRENLPAIIDAAFTALGASPPDDQPLGKSEFWVLHSAQASLAGVERHGLTA